MKMKFIYSVLFIMCSATTVMADGHTNKSGDMDQVYEIFTILLIDEPEKKENWFERKYHEVDDKVKSEYYKHFFEITEAVKKDRMLIVSDANKLAMAVEAGNSKDTMTQANNLAGVVVTTTTHIKLFAHSMMKKAGHKTEMFSDLLYGEDEGEKLLRHDAPMFSEDAIDSIYDLFDHAKVDTSGERKIKAEYKDKVKLAENEVKNTYRKYSGYFLVSIASGKEYEQGKKEYMDAMTKQIMLGAEIYGKALSMLSSSDKKKVIEKRKMMTDKMLTKFIKM